MKVRPLHDRVVVSRVDSETRARAGVVVVDSGYIREQASEALRTFVAPLSGIYAAAFGPIEAPVEKEMLQKAERVD